MVTSSHQRRVAGTYVITSFAGAWIAFQLRSLAIAGPGRVYIVVGVVLFWAGIGLRQWAVHTLGRFFTFTLTVRSGQRVVDSGPYRVLRHPSYSGLLLSNIGFAIALGNWLALAVLIIPYGVSLVRRIEVEEAMLRQGLGPAYDDFARSRKRIVPGVW